MGRGFARVLPDALVAVAVLVLSWPMWTSGGHGLARDLVFTPRAPWSLDAIGMGTSLPRAVPLDAALAAATTLVDGAVVFRVAVAGVLLAAGWGAHRMLGGLLTDASTSSRCVVAVAAVWNPYVIERLALGQWALLAAYAALWWLLPAVRRALAGERSAWWAVVVLTWLGSLTPTGGAVLVLVALAGGLVAVARRSRGREAACLLALTLAAQLPWVLAGVLGTASAASDPTGVEVFAARAERAGGVWPTLVATGGVWSPFQVPGSLESWTGHALTVAVVVVLVVGGRLVAQREPALAVAAAAGFVLAGAAHLPGGSDALAWAVEEIPGTGLLRDGHKWLMPYVVALVAAAGVAAGRAEAALRRRDAEVARIVVAALALLPVALVPDAAGRTWQAVRPVDFPAELAEAVALLDEADGTGEVVTVPWASYRQFSWGNPVSAPDPLPRWTERPTVVSDTLVVGSGTVTGEDSRAREVGLALESAERPLGEALEGVGVGWVLVYRDQPGAAELDPTDLTLVVDGPDVQLYRVAHVDSDRARAGDLRVLTVVAVDAAWGLALLAGLVGVAVAARGSRRRQPPDGPEVTGG